MERVRLLSSVFRSMKNLPKEDEKTEEEVPCTSYSNQEDRNRSRRKTPNFGRKKEDKLTNILPKSIQSIHEYLKQLRREMSEESPKGFEPQSNSRSSHSECEHAATHCAL